MDKQVLNDDVEISEGVDQYLHEQAAKIDDVSGALEAVGQAITGGEEPVQLTDHQQEMVDAFKDARAHQKAQVYAVADQAALESYVDEEGILRPFTKVAMEAYITNSGTLVMDGNVPPRGSLKELPKSMKTTDFANQTPGEYWEFADKYGPNAWAAIEYNGILLPGNEGLLEVSIGIAKKAIAAFAKEIPGQFKVTAKGLEHYIDMAQRLRERLLQLKPLLRKRDYPFDDVFDYGVYSRFFQVNGESINSFSQFKEAMDVQYAATRHTVAAADSYGGVIMQQLLEKIQALQAEKNPSEEGFAELRDSIERTWERVWKEADITPKHGQTPQAALNAFPDRRFVSIAPLLDNRYLVAHKPKSDGGKDPVKITAAIKHYGAAVVFDKHNNAPKQSSMNVPNLDDLEAIVVQTINGLYELQGLKELAKKNNGAAKDFQKASEILSKVLADSNDPKLYGFVNEYFKLATALSKSIQQPYVQMAWMYIRCAMVVVSLLELAVLEEPKKRVVALRFATNQQTEFSNPALESFQLTKKLLKAGQRAIDD